jgi:hypothetical protein
VNGQTYSLLGLRLDKMPKRLEAKLKNQARKRGLKGKAADAYVFGTLMKLTDWKPGSKKHEKK